MNFVSKFDGSLPVTGTHPKAQLHVETAQTRAPADAIVVKDANLLFNGDFKRTGLDLVISRDDQELVLPDYFKGDKRAALASSDGAYLTGKTIEVLTGHVQFAQADGSAAAAKIIGHVTKLSGSATVVRNGVSIVLNNGDTVYQGDVVQSGSNSTVGITFIDGSVFGLASNARMVLNEMVYDPNGSGNSSFLTLVQGTISFVAGATAKHGDMKVDTPVATMGIRGTAVLAEIDFEVTIPGTAPPVRFQVLVEPDGTTGSYVLLDRVTLTQIATVNQPGTVTTVSGAGAVSFLASAQLSPELMKLISEVFSQKFTDNTNPKSDTHFTDTVIPQTTFPVQFASGETGTATVTVIAASEGPGGTPPPQPKAPDRIPGPPGVVTSNRVLAELPALTGSSLVDTTSGTVSYTDLNPGDVPTVSTAFSSFAYANAAGVTVTSSLTSAQLSAITAVSVPLTVVQDPAGKNNGTAIWTYNVEDNALDFLAQGEKLTLTYMARVDNNFAANNEFSFAPFTITITGTNDTPTIASEAQTAEIEELAGEVDSDTLDTATGTILFEDVDLTDTHGASIIGVTASGTVTGLPAAAGGPGAAAAPSNPLYWLSLGDFIDSTDGVTGSQVWNFSAEDHYFDYLAEGETLTLTYTVEVVDNNGATVTEDVVVTVTGSNDAPELAIDISGDDGLHAITELEGVTGDDTDDTASGSLTFRDVDLSDTHSVDDSGPTFVWLDANGDPLPLSISQQSVLTLGSTFELTLNESTGTGFGSIDFSYSAADYYFDFLAEGETLTITYEVTVLDEHNVASTQPVTITVTGSNDVPVAVADVGGGIVEAGHDANNDPVAGNATTSGNVLDNDTDVDLTDTHTVVGVAAGTATSTLSSGVGTAIEGVYGTLTLNADGTWTYTLNNDDPDTNALAEGAEVVDIFSYTQSDPFAATSTTTLTINITGTNDEPVANAAPVAATDVNEGDPIVEQGVNPGNTAFAGLASAEGNVLANDYDVDTGDTKTVQGVVSGTATGPVTGQVGTVVTGTYGTLTLNADGTWTYTLDNDNPATQGLAQDESVADVFTYTMHDTLGSTSSATLSIAITGTNDAPVVAEALTDTAAEGDQSFPVDLLAGASDVDDGATLSVTNVSYAVDGVGPSLTPPAGISVSGSTLTVDPGDPAFDHLAVGDTMTIVVAYDVTDEHGATVQQTETVTITGTNDVPTVAAALVDAADEGDAAFTQDLLEGASDLDDGETGTLSVVNVTYSVNGGTASTTAPAGVSLTGSTLNVDPTDPAFNSLAAGVTMVILVSYDVIDAQGAPVAQTETITITGTNDAPVITAAQQTATGEFAVSHAGSTDNTVPALASIGDGKFVVTYMSLQGGSFDVYAEILDSDGNTVTGPFLVNTNVTSEWQGYQDVVALADGTFIVTWDDQLPSGGLSVFGARFDQQGTTLDGPFNIGTPLTGDDFPKLVALPNGGFAVAWHSEGADRKINAQFFDAHGVPTTAEIDVSADAGDEKYPDIIALQDGRVVVTWQSSVSGQQLLGRIVEPDGDLGPVFQVNTGGLDFLPDAVGHGREEHQFRQFSASLDDGGFVVVWTSEHDGSFDIYGQMFNADGSARGGQILIAADPVLADLRPTVTGTSDGGFVVTWHRGPLIRSASEETDTPADDIYAQRFDASGQPVGSEFLVNTTQVGRQYYPEVTETTDGRLVIVWASSQNGAGGTSAGVYGRTFDLPGLVVASVSVAENTTEVTTVTSTDVDGGTPTYSIVTGTGSPDAALFTINETTGELSFVNAPNFEVPGSAAGSNVYTIQVQVSDGAGGVDVQTIAVEVTDTGETLQANADTVFTNVDTPITLSTLTANDTSSGTTAPQIVSVYNAKNGTVALNNGAPVFTPDPGFTGTASFSYWISETPDPTPPGSFGGAVNYEMGAYPQAVTLADINDDGILDMLTSNYTSNTISFRYGNGDGTFESSLHQLTAGANPSTPIVVADFNNDGNMDLAVGNFGSDNISIFYSNGSGGYNAAINYAAGDGPEGLSGADVNGDGNVDLIVSNYNAGTVAVTISNGDGSFQTPVSYAVGALPYLSALADLDGDGNLDIVVGNAGSNNISVLLGTGTGTGTFEAAVNYATPAGSNAVAIGDVNGDGILDIVSSNGTASVFLGNGDGTFQSQISYAAGGRTKGIALADFDEDGDLDIVVANSRDPALDPDPQTNHVSILFNNGNGTFGAPVSYETGWDTYHVAVADLNGDGRPDIVAPNELSDNVSVLLNAAPGGALSSTTVTVNVVQTTGAMQLVGHALLGGAGNQAASSVEYFGGHLYLTYNGPVTQTTSDYSNVVSFATAPSDAPTQEFSLAWTKGFFNGVTSDGANIYAVGASHPGAGLTSDGSGGAEVKTLLATFNANGTAGTNPSFAPATDYAATNFFSYRGVEIFYDVLATEQGGETVLYAVGFGQPSSYGAYVIAAFDANGDLLYPAAVDPLPVPGFSVAYEAVEFNNQIWAIGYNQHPTGRATVWAASYDLSSVVTYENTLETDPASFYGAAVIGSNLYAVGYVASTSNGNQYLVAKYNTDGSIAWSESFGGSGDEVLTGAVSINGHLYVVGYTTDTSGNTDGVLMEISTVDGSVISTTSYGGALYDAFNSITTDGHYLYVAGESKSFTSGGNGAGEGDAILLTFDPGLGPVINTEAFTVAEVGNISTVTDISITSTSAGAVYTLTAETTAPGSTVVPTSTSGSLQDVNTALETTGLTYDPGTSGPDTDMVTLTVTDELGNSDIVNFIFNEDGAGPTVTLTGTPEKDVIFATGYDDVLTGGAKADQFVFTPEDAAGDDVITDFTLGEDRIDLRAFTNLDTSNIEAWLDNPANVSQQGANTVITLDGDNTVTLTNVSATSLSASNFIVSQYNFGL